MLTGFPDLAYNVENTFCCTLPKEQLDQTKTVGDLYDLVLARRFRGNRQVCLNSYTFQQVRQALVSVQSLSPDDVQSNVPLATLIPHHRRRTWRMLQKVSGYRLPELCRPYWLILGIWIFTLAMGFAVPISLSLTLLNGAVLAALLTMCVVAYTMVAVTCPFAYEFPADCTTVGELSAMTLAHNYRKIVDIANTAASDDDVWKALQAQIACQLGLSANAVAKSTVLPGVAATRRLRRTTYDFRKASH